MTLERTTERILKAAEAQDLAALAAASLERQSAISMVYLMPQTPALRDAVAASIAAGAEAKRAIQAIRQRLRKEGRRLVNIEQGFLRGLAPAAPHRVDWRG